jgi:hypothetical protein
MRVRNRPKTEQPYIYIALIAEAAEHVTVGVGVLLAADSQSTSKSGHRASLWDP